MPVNLQPFCAYLDHKTGNEGCPYLFSRQPKERLDGYKETCVIVHIGLGGRWLCGGAVAGLSGQDTSSRSRTNCCTHCGTGSYTCPHSVRAADSPAKQAGDHYRDTLFKFNSSQLLGHDIRVLDEVANFAQKYPDAVLDVNGYCSKVGNYAYNQKLSEQRAESVARYLRTHGVPDSRMAIKGYSYKDPIASNATSQGRFQNQRVEINSTIQVEKTVG